MTPFDLVLLPFPFTGLQTSKQRPGLVLAKVHPRHLTPLYVVAMVTSRIAGLRFTHDVQVEQWQEAGLPKPSLIRLAKLVTIEEQLIRRRLGRLASVDAERVRAESSRLFGALSPRR